MESSIINKCFFCDTDIKETDLNGSLIYSYHCNCCKNVEIRNQTAINMLKYKSDGYKISHYLRIRFENEQEPIIINNKNIVEIIKDFSPKTLSNKIDKFLLYLSKKSDFIGKPVIINYKYDYTIFGCKNSSEFVSILQYLNDDLIKKDLHQLNSYTMRLTFDGWKRIEEIEKLKIESNQAFVAMWFHTSMDDLYAKAIKPAIKESNYEPFRIDSKQHNNKICDEIIIEIRRSKFLVADVTELRGGIYFEAGYAMGLGIPVIWTCREDKIHEVHFDTRQYNHIVWKDEKDLYTQLKNRIQATIFVT